MTILIGILVRTLQTAVEASPTLLAGVLISAVLRQMLGSAGTRRLFGGGGWRGLFRAWFIGSLLPVCALGVIPVARELRRAGVPTATVLAFVLAAPQLNPLSFLYGLTLSEPIVIISFVGVTMILAVLGGELWKRLFGGLRDAGVIEDEPLPAPGVRRLIAVAVAAGRELLGRSLAYVILGVVATGVMAGVLPHGSMSMSMRHDDPMSPLVMALFGLPAYSNVLPGMMRIGLIFEHGNSVGAAFVLFTVGVGFNAGLVAWLLAQYGVRSLLWLAVVVALAVGAAYAMEPTLYFANEEASHTHAFDDWTNPFQSGQVVSPGEMRLKVAQRLEVLEPVALLVLAGVAVVGAVAHAIGRSRLDGWLTRAPATADGPRAVWDRSVPGPVLGLFALLGLVAFSVAALYIYYPDQEQAFAEIVQTRTEAIVAVRTGNREEAIRRLEHWDLLTRKLQVGVFLRTGRLDPDARRASDELREVIEQLRDTLLANDPDKAKSLLKPVEESYRACRDRFEGRE